MKSIGLCMIVKDEARLIERCLDSVRPLLDYALIVDTGSTDDTGNVVRNYLSAHDLPGEVIDRPFTDFGESRSFALAKLREHSGIDYALVIDADDVLRFPAGFDKDGFKESLDKAFYDMEVRHGVVSFWRPQLVSNHVEFKYLGVLYEFLAGPQGEGGAVSGVFIETRSDGVRSQNPNKYRDDARMLETAIEAETEPFIRARYTFYLALSLMNANEPAKALTIFRKRTEMGGFEGEITVSLHAVAQLKQALGYRAVEIIGSYLQAYERDATRAEPLHGAMQFCRVGNQPHQAYLIGKHGLTLARPLRGFWVAPWIYDYGLIEEFSIAAYQSGHLDDCRQALERLLAEGKLPADSRPRIERNLQAIAGLTADGAARNAADASPAAQ
jgi:glycosyltransferase involved in cell wall biosynthesis